MMTDHDSVPEPGDVDECQLCAGPIGDVEYLVSVRTVSRFARGDHEGHDRRVFSCASCSSAVTSIFSSWGPRTPGEIVMLQLSGEVLNCSCCGEPADGLPAYLVYEKYEDGESRHLEFVACHGCADRFAERLDDQISDDAEREP